MYGRNAVFSLCYRLFIPSSNRMYDILSWNGGSSREVLAGKYDINMTTIQ